MVDGLLFVLFVGAAIYFLSKRNEKVRAKTIAFKDWFKGKFQ